MTREWIRKQGECYMPEDMTLDQAMLELVEADCIMCIGAATNYFFIGDCNEYKDQIKDIDARYNHRLRNRVYTQKQDLFEHANRQLKKEMHGYNGEIIQKEETLEQYISRLMLLKKRYENNIERLENWIPLSERKVEKIYPLATHKGVGIIIEGNENGDFWDLEEWEKVHKKKEVA